MTRCRPNLGWPIIAWSLHSDYSVVDVVVVVVVFHGDCCGCVGPIRGEAGDEGADHDPEHVEGLGEGAQVVPVHG